nr:2Fe-2S iron-sulfur cluster-binding protein [Sphingomonas sp. Y57]
MVMINFRDPEGKVVATDARSGLTLMEAALNAGVEGIEAACGGACSCATCHVYVDPSWTDELPGPSDLETDMLEIVNDRRPNSRLSCQIKIAAGLQGLEVAVPATQDVDG